MGEFVVRFTLYLLIFVVMFAFAYWVHIETKELYKPFEYNRCYSDTWRCHYGLDSQIQKEI